MDIQIDHHNDSGLFTREVRDTELTAKSLAEIEVFLDGILPAVRDLT